MVRTVSQQPVKTNRTTKHNLEVDNQSVASTPKEPTAPSTDQTNPVHGPTASRKIYLTLAVIGIAALIWWQKSLFVSAMVNGSPVSNFELQTRLNQQFKKQVLEQLINEKLILSQAKAQGIIISKSEIDGKIAEIEKQVGSPTALDNILIQQSQTREGLRNQIALQLSMEKMYGHEASVSAQELEQFMAQNKDMLQATGAAEQLQEAQNILKERKLSSVLGEKFDQLKQKAKVQIF